MPFDHVPDSHGPAGGAQSAHRLRGPVQTIPAWEEDECGTGQLGRVGGFSLHGGGLPSGVAVNTRERKKLERICRYISRPALSEARLELTDQGMVSYALKTAYLRGPIGMGLLGGNPTRVIRAGRPSAIGFYGQTGSTGAQSSNESHGAGFMPLGAGTISWSTGTEQSVPRERDTAKCSPGRTCHC